MKVKAKEILKKIGSIGFALVVFLLAALIAITIYSKISGKRVLSYSVLWVLSDSMEDTIPAKSYILVKSVTADEVEVGDIITFRSEDPSIRGQLNTHRVISVGEDHSFFQTKGDHNDVPDFYAVPRANVEAKYVRNLPLITLVGRLFATRAGLLVTVGVMAIALGVWIYLLRLESKKNAAKDSEKDDEIRRRIEEEVLRLQRENAQANAAESEKDTAPNEENDKN